MVRRGGRWRGVGHAVGAAGSYSPAVVVTVAGSAGALPGTGAASVKVTPLHEYPGKGRATGGVRCHRFLKGEDMLVMAWAGPAPAVAATDTGTPVQLPDPVGKRDGSGSRSAGRSPSSAVRPGWCSGWAGASLARGAGRRTPVR